MATAVFFHAHPDDESIATGGTMTMAAEAGHRVVLVMATRGECGEPVEGVLEPGEPLGDRRSEEVHRSAEILGVHRVEFLGYRDSGMIGEPSNDHPESFWRADVKRAASALAELLREEQADVLTMYDDNGGYGHPDHIQVHRVGAAAASLAGTSGVFEATMNRDEIIASIDAMIAAGMADPEMVQQRASMEHEPFGSADALITHRVDVRAALIAKRSSMAAHASQIGPDAFFLAMADEQFAAAFGFEHYIAHRLGGDGTARYAPRVGDYAESLFS